MMAWAWRGKVAVERVTAQFVAVMALRGFVPAKGKGKQQLKASVYADGKGGTLVVAYAPGGPAVAAAMSRGLSAAGRYAEIAMTESQVSATSRSVAGDGGLGPEQDRTVEANKLCDEWFQGKKYKTDKADDLAAIFVELEACPKEGSDLVFDRVPGSARVQTLVDAVYAGAKWEKTEIAGRPAVRVTDSAGTRISVLDDTDLATFEAEVARVVAPR